jgi:signal transduction histidine kinase
VSTDPVSPPTLASLRASRAQQDTVLRWLRPLAPFVVIMATWTALRAHPGPGLHGRGLAVALALGGFVVGGLGAAGTLWRPSLVQLAPQPSRVYAGLVYAAFAVLFAASAALVWLQPDGVSVAGIFLGVTLLSRQLRRTLSVPLIVVTLVCLAVALATSDQGSIASSILTAITLGAFYGSTFMATRLREANEVAERLLIELEQSREGQARAAGLAERQRLAREMHDVLAHSLSGLMLQLEAARMLAAADPGDPRLPQAVNRAHQLGKTGLDEARRAIGMLRDDELPGPERLAGLAAQFQQDREIPCRFTVSGPEHQLGSEARLALYRVTQEALTNITKHARPQRVELHLAYEPSATRLTVEDFTVLNGTRPATAGDGPGDGDGYGLTGMRERAELLGGTLTTETTSSGFRVELDVPR